MLILVITHCYLQNYFLCRFTAEKYKLIQDQSWPTFGWLLFSTLQLYQKKTPTQLFSCEYCGTFKNTYFEEHLRMRAHEYQFIYYFKFQRHHFNVLLSIKERHCLKPCKDNAALSTILRRCSDVLITKSISQQYNNDVLTSITTWFYQQHNNVAWTSFR